MKHVVRHGLAVVAAVALTTTLAAVPASAEVTRVDDGADATASLTDIRVVRVRHGEERVTVKAPVHGKTQEIDITDELRAACESLLGPFSETLLDLLAAVEPEYQEKVRRNVWLSGRGSGVRGLAEALEKTLDDLGGGKVRRVEDPVFAGASGSLAIALDADEDDWEKVNA